MRHRYRMDAGRDGVCICGQGRSEGVHNMLTWRKSSGVGFWYSGPVNGVVYRIRTRLGKAACWWPEFSLTTEENWTRIGSSVGTSLANAKALCEQHREERP
jgi:hypothetical protein